VFPLPLLQFKKTFKPAILEGRKTTTLRRWRSCKWRPGDRVTTPGVGALVLESVDQVQWDMLTDADARADGFASLAELAATIRRIYPKLDGDGKAWFKLKFHCEAVGLRQKLAAMVRAELDKAVRGNGSLPLR